MEIEDLNEEQKEFIRLLRHGTYSVERVVFDAFEESETPQDFSDRATNDLEEISADAVAAIEEIHKLFEKQQINGIRIIAISTQRLSPKDYPQGKHYSIRHNGNDWTTPITIEHVVVANRYGSIILYQPIEQLEIKLDACYTLTKEEQETIKVWVETGDKQE